MFLDWLELMAKMMRERTDGAVGLGYFVYYVWTWATHKVDPVIENANRTLIALIDRIRMLDNDLIRLNTKLNMILEYERKQGNEKSKKDKRWD